MTWPDWPPAERRSGPLAGIKILDLSAFAVGPWATSLLALLGADVLKIEPPYGDPIHNVGPQRGGLATTYAISNLGKRSVVLDLKEPQQREIAMALAAQADVLVENSREGALARLGFDPASLRRRNPALVYCASSSFGSDGPMAGVGSTDPQGQAFSGFVSIQGAVDSAPEFLRYVAAVDLSTAIYLAQAVLVGLLARDLSGVGATVKTSQFEAALALQSSRLAEFLVTGTAPRPEGSGNSCFAPSAAFATRDRQFVAMSADDDRTWLRLCAALERDDLGFEPRYRTNRLRVERRRELHAELQKITMTKDARWWLMRLREHDVPASEFVDLDRALSGSCPPDVRDHLASVAHPVRGQMAVVRPPWIFDRTPAQLFPPPLPGQNTNIVADAQSDAQSETTAGAAAVPATDRSPLTSEPAEADPTALPLLGLRVLEVSQGVAGPYCGSQLVALGATVTKLEPSGGDRARYWSPEVEHGSSAAFLALNRGKRSVRLPDSGAPDAIDALVAYADVIVLDADLSDWHLDGLAARLSEAAEGGAIVCAIASADGSCTGRRLSELELQARSGLLRYLGTLGGPPIRVGADIAGTVTGGFAVQAVLAALFERRRSQLGQRITVDALRSLLAVLSVMIAAIEEPDTWDGFHCSAAAAEPEHGVPTADGAISFRPPRRSDESWQAICAELGATRLAVDPQYRTDLLRTPKIPQINRELAAFTRDEPRARVLEVVERNSGIGVPVLTYPEIFAHPQMSSLDFVDRSEDYSSLRQPWRIDGRRPRVVGRSPDLAEHSDDADRVRP